MTDRSAVPKGFKVIYTPWIRNPKTGERIYPKNARVFRFVVPINPE